MKVIIMIIIIPVPAMQIFRSSIRQLDWIGLKTYLSFQFCILGCSPSQWRYLFLETQCGLMWCKTQLINNMSGMSYIILGTVSKAGCTQGNTCDVWHYIDILKSRRSSWEIFPYKPRSLEVRFLVGLQHVLCEGLCMMRVIQSIVLHELMYIITSYYVYIIWKLYKFTRVLHVISMDYSGDANGAEHVLGSPEKHRRHTNCDLYASSCPNFWRHK